jgi:hypothetical protein
MITLHDIFIDLSGGEFSNLKIGAFNMNDPESEPDPRSYLQLIRHINLGLTAIYTEFLLRSEECYVELHEQIALYHLDYRWASSNAASTEDPKYIIDTVANPFNDNVLKIEEVYDEGGNLLRLNDPQEELSVFTPRFNTIQVPWPNDFNTLAVQYRADHPTISYVDGMAPDEVYVEVPRQLREALLFYVASRVYAGINTEKPEANDYYRKYVAKINDINRIGLYITTDQDNDRFTEGGWL